LPSLLRETTATTTMSYIHGPDGSVVESVDGAGTTTYHYQDQLGSTRVLTDSSGAVTATFGYDSYGNLTGSTGTATTPFGWSGEWRDSASGLIYARARWLDTASSAWLSVDPAFAATGSRYGYVNGDPLNATDPSGLYAETGVPAADAIQVAGEALVAGGMLLAHPFFGHHRARCNIRAKRQPRRDMLVYRVYGGASGKWGQSWTPINPQSIGQRRYRSVAGLPDENAGTNVVIARLRNLLDVVAVRSARPYVSKAYGTTFPGGLTEYIIPDPQVVLNEVRSYLANPNY